MLRIHLAQIFYNLAYYDSPVDYLEEPCFLAETDTPIGKLRSVDQIENFLSNSKRSYIEHLRNKLRDIVCWSGERKAHFLVFPEYSVPFQLLPDMQSLARQYSMTIIAGTHRVVSGNEATSVYQSLGIFSQSTPVGSACAPVFLPDGSVQIATKLRKSKWEPNLTTPDKDPEIINVDYGDTTTRLSVIPCIDSLHPDVLGKLWAKDNPPELILCPAMSPSNEPFHTIGSISALKETLFAYINTASFGGTSFNLPSDWQPYLKGYAPNTNELPENVEAILEIDVDPKKFFAKKGSIENTPVCSHPLSFPIVYTKGAGWLSKFDELRNDLIEWLKASDPKSAIEWIDSYLTEEASSLPDIVLQNLKYLRHSILPLYDGNLDSIKTATETVKIADNVDDTRVLWAKRINSAICILTDYLKVPTTDLTDDNILLNCLQSLRKLQQSLPFPLVDIEGHKPLVPAKIESSVFIGEENLIEAFQNRGGVVDTMRNFFANAENRVIIVTGAMGIGKSDFLNWAFRKQFGDWEVVRIPIPRGAKFSRILADIGYRLGISLDIDSLASISHKVFRQKIRKVLAQFYTCPKRALILDNLHQILREGNAHDHRQLATFLEEAAAPDNFVGGRIFLVSSQWLPDNWLHTKGVAHLRLKGLEDIYVRRIIEFNMRRLNLVKDEAIPEVPQALLDMVKGHPLSAKLVVEVLYDKDIQQLSDELTLEKITGQVAKKLLSHIDISSDEQMIMQKLSVFRLPIRIDILRQVDEFNLNENQLMGLAKRCILDYDGQSFEMHEAVRRFYRDSISSSNLKIEFHHLAALYYQIIYENQRFSKEKDPSIIAELAHHLSLSGEISKAKDLRLLVLEEIKPTARQIYREYHDYQRALSLYRLVADIAPDDLEVLAYIGRCYARLGQWKDSDQAFQHAIDIASRIGSSIWWIYRDWGHIRARYKFYSEAKQHFDKASAINPDDISIKANIAYIYWRQGNNDEAYKLFEEAIGLNQHHEYTLTFYSKFLHSIGEYDYANIIHEKLLKLDSGDVYSVPTEYDIVDYDDQ